MRGLSRDPHHYYGRAPEATQHRDPQFVDLEVDGKRIEVAINERFELRVLPPTAADLAEQKKYAYLGLERRTEKVWSGVLRLKRERPAYGYHVDAKSWRDSANHSLVSQIPKILADFRAVAARMHEVDEEHERELRAREEAARLQQELSARRADNSTLIEALERQAGAWARAQFLRCYLRAARRAVGSRAITVTLNDQPTDFLSWAEHYVNQLDPLHREPRDLDLQRERSSYYGSDEKFVEEELQRPSGHAWERSSKLVAGPTCGNNDSDDPTDDDDS